MAFETPAGMFFGSFYLAQNIIRASSSILLTRPVHGDLDFNPPHPVIFLRDRLWRFAALVIGTPSHSIFFEEHIFKPGNVITISYSVKRIYHPWGFSTGDDLYCRCPARPGRWTSLCSSAVASSTTSPIAPLFLEQHCSCFITRSYADISRHLCACLLIGTNI
jgi:hypothetical protein